MLLLFLGGLFGFFDGFAELGDGGHVWRAKAVLGTVRPDGRTIEGILHSALIDAEPIV